NAGTKRKSKTKAKPQARQNPQDELPEWYHHGLGEVNCGKCGCERSGHPPPLFCPKAGELSAEIVSPRSASGPAIILPAGVADTWSRIIRQESNMRRGAEMRAVLIQFAGTSTGAPLSLTRNTTNFAGLVWLAFRPTT